MIKIIADLHTHTVASGHGADTLRTMCEFAIKKGFKGIAITDHGPGLPGVLRRYILCLSKDWQIH